MVSFSEIKTILESVAELVKKSATLDLQEKIVSLREYIISMREENITLKEENQTLKQEIANEHEFNLRDGMLWRVGDSVPFCQKCLEGDKKRIHLQRGNNNSWKCLECGKYYYPDGEQGAHIFRPTIYPRNSSR